MENVPNLLTAEKGFFKKEITDLFSSIGYTIDSDVLNASDFGVPQNRRRAFIIGKLGDRKVKFPEKKKKNNSLGSNKRFSIFKFRRGRIWAEL